LYRGFSDFKKGNQPRTNIVGDEKGDLVANCTIFWSGGVTFFPSYISDTRQTDIHIAEPVVPETSVS